MANNLSLLSSLNRVETPFISVDIGGFTFGVYNKKENNFKKLATPYGMKIQYPNYLQSLDVKKINGQVNKYTLQFSYPITENDDPNFFDKVFSSVSKTRKIVFTYGDLSAPTFIYRNEEAIITSVTQKMNIQSAVINYIVNAVSSAHLGSVGAFNFPARKEKPSVVIKELLYTEYFGLLDIFTGMREKTLVESKNLIPGDDAVVNLEMQVNMSVLDYLSYLVKCMRPMGTNADSNQQGSVYVLNIVDHTTQMYTDTSGQNFIFDGPYFKIVRNDKYSDSEFAYLIDVGFPSENIITSFEIENNENYAILYDYQQKINSSEYVIRLDDNGLPTRVYAPVVSSKNDYYKTTEYDKMWWTRMTEYPIKVTITLKGLLRPAILMSYVRLNVYYWGKKHSSSGLYVITSQTDNISVNGYRTTLTMTRVGGDS